MTIILFYGTVMDSRLVTPTSYNVHFNFSSWAAICFNKLVFNDCFYILRCAMSGCGLLIVKTRIVTRVIETQSNDHTSLL